MKRNKGAVSVFLCAAFMAMILLIGAAGDAGSLAVANSYAKRMHYMACQSVLAGYDRDLYEDYGLMAFRGGTDEVEETAKKYISMMRRVQEDAGEEIVFFDLSLHSLEADSGGACLADPEVFQEQVQTCMKFAAAVLGAEKIKEIISGPISIESSVLGAKQGLAAEKAAAEAAEKEGQGREEGGTQPSGGEPRTPVALNSNRFSCEEEGTADRVLRSERILESLPSKSEYEDRGKKSYGLGKEADLMELGEDSGDFLDRFYAGLNWGANKVAMAEYACLNFKSALSAAEEEVFFSGELEYLLKGNFSDGENRSAVKRDLFLLRTALNIAHIYGDAEKRQITLEAAAGAGPYAPAVQFLFAAAWAGAEAGADIDTLYRGGAVPFIKQKRDWKLQFGSIYGGSSISGEYEGERGFAYEDYLHLFLYTCSQEKLVKRSMDLIQINMKGRYDVQFDLRNCICGFTSIAHFERIPYLPDVLPGIIEKNAMTVEGTYGY